GYGGEMNRTPVAQLCAVSMLLSACAMTKVPAPVISLDEPVPAQAEPIAEPTKPIEVVKIPEPLPLPGQLQPVLPPPPMTEPNNVSARVAKANEEARVPPRGDGYVNAIQVWPYAEGA